MNARKNNLSRKPNLSIERLEDRQMMAGDVVASVANGTLTINEASDQPGSANAVIVSQLPNGDIRVRGLGNQAGGITLVNGQSQQDFTVTGAGSLIMNLGGGQDSAVVGDNNIPLDRFRGMAINTSTLNNPTTAVETDADSVTLNKVRTTAGIQISTGASADLVSLTNTTSGEVGIHTGDGVGSVHIRDATTSASMTINTGNEVDVINIFDSTIGDGAGGDVENLNINTGAGADTVRMNFGESNVTAVRGDLNLKTSLDGQTDIDNIDMRHLDVDGSFTAHFGGGDDILNLLDIYAGGIISLSGENGKDTFTLANVGSGDRLFALMGDGNDVLLMDDVVAAGSMTLNGGEGYDRVHRNRVTAHDLAFTLWENSNGINIAGLPNVPSAGNFSKPITGKG